MAISHNEQKIGVVVGRIKIKDEMEISEIIIYRWNENKNRFALAAVRDFKERDACIQFHFNIHNDEELLFFTKFEIFKWNYEDSKRMTMYTMRNNLED